MKKLFLCSLLLLLVMAVFANTYTIGTGTSSTSYSPFYGLFDYGWNKIIYTAAEINTAGLNGAQNIYGIGFYAYNTPANYVMLDQKVFVRHTTLPNYGTATDDTGTGYPASTGFTQVYDADVVFNGLGWYYLMFSTPFAWDGTSNLEIFYENWDGDYYTGYPTHTYTSTSTNYMTVYKYADTTFPTTVGSRTYNRPNLRLVTQTLDTPLAATLVFPTNGSIALLDASFSWNNSQGMASSYDVYLGTNSDPPYLTNIADMTYAPTLAGGSTYYWKIVARNANGVGASSAIWSFTTPGANQLAESFEGTFPPLGWSNPGGFTRNTTTPYHLTAGAYKSTATAAMLYTPMLELTATSQLNFMARATATTGIGRIQIKHSQDGANWTAIGEPIAMPTNSNWNNYIVDLSSLAGDNYYIGFENYSSTSTAAAITIDFVLGPDFAAISPDPAVVIYPQHGGYAFSDATLSWAAASTGGIPTSYDVYFGTSDTPPFIANQAGTTYAPILEAGTTYFWQIVPRNDTDSAAGCPIWSFTTPRADQLAESFDATTFPPVGWNTPGDAFTRSTVTPYYGAASAYEYIATGPSYLYTPILAITATSELDWWMRTSATTGIGRVQIVYSTDGLNWSNIGAEIVMPTETTWMNYNVDLSSLAGNNYYIGFKVYSSTTTSTYFYIDHVFGPDIAALTPDPATAIFPQHGGFAFTDEVLSWEAATTGGIATSYDVYFGTSDTPPFIANQAGTTYAPILEAGTTYYWQIVPRNDSGSAENCPVWSFQTPGATQLAESFESTTFPPNGWMRTTSSTSYWGRSTTYYYHGVASMYAYTSTSTAYTISTPLLAITNTSTLDFYSRASATSQILQVLYSTDRTNWTQVGDDITYPVASVMNRTVIDLSTITPGNYYLAFHSPVQTAASYIYMDHVFGLNLAAVAPGPVTLTVPADAATDVSNRPTFSWTAPTLGGVPTGYRVYCDTNADPTTEIADVTTLTYTATVALNYSTLYNWKVVAYNGTGDSVENTVRSFTTMGDPTIFTMPWMEDFGTTGATFPPANWTRWSGLLTPEPVTLTISTGYWLQDDFANVVTAPVNYSAKTNIYGTTWKYWLMTPPIQMPGTGYQLEFDLALSDYTNAAPPDDPAGLTGVDDKFVVLISDGSSWSTANAVKVWDNDVATTGGIYEVYNDLPHTGNHWILPLDSYTGIKYIAFYGESTVSNADNDFFVDNVRIRQAGQAPGHVTLVSPANASTADPFNTQLYWTENPAGGSPAWYEVYVGSAPIDPSSDYYGEYLYEPTTNSLDLSAQGNIDLGYNTTWYWGVLPYNEYGNPDPNGISVFQFTTLPDPTITTLPHAEYFDSVTAPALPYGWTSVVDATTTSAYVNTYSSTTYAVSAPNSARLYNSTDVAANLLLIPPDFSMPLNTIKVRFYARSSTAGEDLYIGAYNPTTQVFTQIGAIMDLTTTQTQYTVPLSSYVGTDTFLAFKHGVGTSSRTIYIDNVEFIEMLANDLAATTISGPGILNAGTAYDYVISIFNEGTATQNAYTVNLMNGATVLGTLSVTTPLDPATTAQHTISWTPTTGGVYGINGEVILTGDGNTMNDSSPIKDVYVFDNTMTVIPVGDDATTTSSVYLPVDMYYRNSVTEELYFTDEMHLQSGTITALVYKNTFLNDRPDKAIKIWMAHTAVTDLSGGWLPIGNYSLVFDGTVDFPSGVNNVVIPLDTPFAYTGGTIATRVNRVFDSGALSSSDKFFYTTNAAHSIRSRYLRSDSVTYDPLAPSAAGTTLNYFPNTTFVVQNAVMQTGAVLNGYVYETGGTTPVPGATVTLTDERYSTTTDATGFYEFTFWEAHTVSAFAAKTDYYNGTPVTGIALTMGNTVGQNLYLLPLPEITVSGVVTSNDYPAGLEGATVELFGYHNYSGTTGVDGVFSIPNVKGSSATLAYTWEVSKVGYESQIGSFNAIESPVNLGTIALTENLWTPYNLVATHSGDNAQLIWEAAAEPDYFLFDFEADNGEWNVSGYGDWEWANNYNVANFVIGETGTNLAAPTAAHSGSGMWATKMLTNYSNSGASSYLSKTVDLAGFTSPQIRFWSYENVNGTYDYCQLKVNNTLVWGPSWQIPSTAWVERVVDLSAYANQTVELKFEFYASTVVSLAGWYIDDIYIGPATRNVTQLGSRNADRSLLNYDVYRMLSADEATPANWTTLHSAYADTTYTDNGFGSLAGGTYKWAVKANYSAGLESEAIISNPLGRVYDPSDIAAATVGATVVLSWTAEPGAAYYKVYECDNPYGTFTYLGYSATPTYTINAPTAKKFYRVTAVADEAVPSPAPPAKK